MPQRLRYLVLLGVPVRRLGVQSLDQVRLPGVQFLAQHLPQRVGTSKAGLVDRSHESIGAHQVLEDSAGVQPAGQPVGEVRVYRLGDARAHQQVPYPRRLRVQHLGAQELGDRVVSGGARPAHRFAAAGFQRQRVQAHPGHPDAGAVVEVGDAVVGQVRRIAPQDLDRLLPGQRQVVRVDLGELAAQLVALQGNQACAAADDDQPQPRRRVPDEHVQIGGDGPVADLLGAVEDEHDRLGALGQCGRQPGQRGPVDEIGPGRGGHVRGEAGCVAAQRMQDVGPEHAGRVVLAVEGQPGHRSGRLPGAYPAGGQCGLPGSRRSVDRGDAPFRGTGQQFEEPVAGQVGRRYRGDRQFRRQKRVAVRAVRGTVGRRSSVARSGVDQRPGGKRVVHRGLLRGVWWVFHSLSRPGSPAPQRHRGRPPEGSASICPTIHRDFVPFMEL